MRAHLRALKKLGFRGDISRLKRLRDYAATISYILRYPSKTEHTASDRTDYITDQITQMFGGKLDGFYIDSEDISNPLKIDRVNYIQGLETDMLLNGILCPSGL